MTDELYIKKIVPIILLIEDNKSISYMNKVNEIISKIKQVADERDWDGDYRIVCYSMGAEIRKSSDKLDTFSDFYSHDFFEKNTVNLSKIVRILEGDMLRRALFNSSIGYCVPIVILIADNKTNYILDEDDLLITATSNRWLRGARKTVIFTEDENHDNAEHFEKFCLSKEGCICYKNAFESLETIISPFNPVSTGFITEVEQDSKFVDSDPVIEELDDSSWIDDTVWNDESWD